MSSHPFGLREDPFAATPTLSAEETVQLLQGRILACGGDGAELFPPETCAEVHRWTGGEPGAIWTLAAEAMRLAADDGAEVITADHVLRAAANATDPAAGLPSPATSDAPPPPAAAAPPVGFQLPTEPLGHLDPGTRAWVARFIGPGDRRRTPAARRSPQAPPTRGAAAPHGPPAVPPREDQSRTPTDADSAASQGGPRRRRPRRSRLVGGLGMVVAAPLLVVVAILLYLLPRREHAARKPWGGWATIAARDRSLPAPRRATDPNLVPDPHSGPVPGSPAGPVRQKSSAARLPATRPARVGPAAPSSAGTAAAGTTAALPASTRPESVRREASNRRLGLEVAEFIFEARAMAERDRLAAAGYPVHVRTEWENGTATYRVVLGSFASRSEAERAADELLSSGFVRQARVVSLEKRD